jgi:hypothetical protein
MSDLADRLERVREICGELTELPHFRDPDQCPGFEPLVSQMLALIATPAPPTGVPEDVLAAAKRVNRVLGGECRSSVYACEPYPRGVRRHLNGVDWEPVHSEREVSQLVVSKTFVDFERDRDMMARFILQLADPPALT